LGAAAEAGVIEQRLYNAAGLSPDIRIVKLATGGNSELPLDLQRYHSFRIPEDEADLTRWLTTDGGRPAAAPAARWPSTPPALQWPLCNHHAVRDCFASLLTHGSGHKALFLRGPSGSGKTAVTEQLLGNALRLDGLICGRFDFKGSIRLREELQRFSSHLDLAAPRGDRVVDALNELLQAVLARHVPTLLIFDTFEVAAEAADWVDKTLLTALIPPRVSHVRVVISGQALPQRHRASWAAEVVGPV